MGKQTRKDGLLGNAPVSNDTYLLDRIRALSESGACANGQREGEQEPSEARSKVRGGALTPQRAGDGSVLDLHRAGALRRAQVLVRSKNRLHGKNMHTL